MATKTKEQIINQAISDFDDVKAALEENGIDVPYDTDTSTYGNMVRKAITTVKNAIPKPETIDAGQVIIAKSVDGEGKITETAGLDEIALLIETDTLPAVHNADGKILTDQKGSILLRY